MENKFGFRERMTEINNELIKVRIEKYNFYKENGLVETFWRFNSNLPTSLSNNFVNYYGDLIGLTEADLLKMEGVGKVAVKNIMGIVEKHKRLCLVDGVITFVENKEMV